MENHMSRAEAMMWSLEHDPQLAPSGGSVTLFDRELDFERFRRCMTVAVSETPRLFQRVVPGGTPLATPRWVVDRDFALDRHVSRMEAPGSGTFRELLDWLTAFLLAPYDRARPLWQVVVVEGLVGGRGALLMKLHHAIADGHRALRIVGAYTRVGRDAPDPPEVDLDALIGAQPADPEANGAEVAELVSQAVRAPADLARKAVDLFKDPERMERAGTEVVDLLRTASDQLQPAGSSLWRERSGRRHLEVLSVPFAPARAAAKALGGTLNDFFLTGAVESARRYHAEFGEAPDRFHITLVVSTRAEGDAAENAFTPVPLELPGDSLGLRERFAVVHELVARRRETVHGSGPMTALAGIVNLLPAPLVTGVIRNQARRIDFATSNVPGVLGPSYVAGARTLDAYAFGPVAGTAFNLTQISMNESLDLGLHVDPAAVAEPELLRRCLEEVYRELSELA